MGRIRDKNVYVCALLCFLIGIASFAYYMCLDGGILTVREDFNLQQIPFLTALNQYFKEPAGMWCWNADLGAQMIGAYSFYNMGSPFVWLSFLFPKGCVPYLTGWLYILKYMVAGITAYLYLRRFVKDGLYAVLGGALYSFSGFQCINLYFFHFHDVVAFFPLLLLGLEEVVYERKKALLIFAVFINCMTNYFFFISEVVFLALYYMFRFWKRGIRLFLKDALICLGCGGAGVGMAAILFLPSILYILGDSRAKATFNLLPLMSYGGYILLSAKGFLLPSEAISNQSSIMAEECLSTNCYIPLIGGSLAFAYILTKRKDWLARFLLILWVISCSPAMDSMFYLFTKHYKRWWFMFVLMLVMASARVLDDREHYRIKTGIVINGVFLALFAAGVAGLNRISPKGYTFIFNQPLFWTSCGLSLAGLLITWFLFSSKGLAGHFFRRGLTVCVSLFCVATTSYSMYLYRERVETGREYMSRYQVGLRLKALDEQYRYNLSDNILVMPGEAVGLGAYTTTRSHSIYEFDSLFDYQRMSLVPISDVLPGARELLAAKYDLTKEVTPGQKVADAFSLEGTDYYVVESDVCPIGFLQDFYITKEELRSLPVNKRGIAMIDSLVIESKDEGVVAPYLEHRTDLEYTEDQSELPSLVSFKQERKVKDFKRSRSGFQCTVASESGGAAFFTVPYDHGWSAYVDGNEADILNSGGMMGILLAPGEHSVDFHYQVPGLVEGMWVSAVSFCMFAFLLWKEGRRQPRKEICT